MSAARLAAAATPARRKAGQVPWLDWMVLPTVGVLAVVVGYPIVYTLVLSGQSYNLLEIEQARFIGAGNYRHLLSDPTFWEALKNTAVYTFGSVAAAALIGLALALLTENLGGRRFRLVRALLLTPWAVPFVVTAFLFRYMYLQNGGIINAVLLASGVTSQPVPWLNDATLTMPAVMAANVWAMAPFFFLLMSAALAGIPNEVVIGSLLMIIANFNDFAKIWAMTQGGPGYSTTTLVIYVYRLAFENFDFGYASAIGVVWLAMLFVFALAYLRALRMQ
jgi:multiple sugar transport system permease protein